MRFMLLKGNISLEDLGEIGTYAKPASNIESESAIYDVENTYRRELEVLAKLGQVSIIKEERLEIESADDIIRLTGPVQLLQGGRAKLRVRLAEHEFEFDEIELLSPRPLMVKLLRLKRFIKIRSADWEAILRYWLDKAEDVKEIAEEDEKREEIIRYLSGCVIYQDREKALGKNSLYLNKDEEGVVYCHAENLKRMLEPLFSLRRIRWLLSEYLVGSSIQIRVSGERRRFWRFKIDKCEIDLSKQMFKEEEEEHGPEDS